MNGKDIANMIHNLKQISRSDVSGMMREQLRNSIIDECAQFVERKLEGYAIVKIEQAERMEALDELTQLSQDAGLYDDPPVARTNQWVGLTHKERLDIYDALEIYPDMPVAIAIEAKLWEKNT